MKPKMILKLAVDIGMTAALLLLMAYELVGQAAHEWIGIGMFVLSSQSGNLSGLRFHTLSLPKALPPVQPCFLSYSGFR